MARWIYGLAACAGFCTVGCTHLHSVLTVDADGGGERIATKYRYSVSGEFMPGEPEKWHPDVFASSFDQKAVPVEVKDSTTTLEETGGGWTYLLGALSFWTIPVVETVHENKTRAYRVGDIDVAVRTCGSATSSLANNPLPWLIFNWGGHDCIANGKVFAKHSSSLSQAHVDRELERRAHAYALAVRLKELEDAGRIDDALVARAMSARGMMAVAWMQEAQQKEQARIARLKGRSVGGEEGASSQPFEMVSLESEAGRDFAYRFVLAQKGAMSLADYGAIREEFRSAIRGHYAMNHPEVNQRTLVADFVEYSARQGRIEGKVVILSLAVERLVYDAATRKGRISVRVGVNQLDEARAWLRKNVWELAAHSSVVVEGDSIPDGARFYSGSETLREDGILELEFKTE